MPPKAHSLTGTAHVSGTRQRTYRECNRKYWWQYNTTTKVNSPETDAHRLGKRVHWLAENYIRAGLEPDEVPIPDSFYVKADLREGAVRDALAAKSRAVFSAGKMHWPKGRGVLAEEGFGVPIPGRPGEAYTGTMDVYEDGKAAEIVALWPGNMRIELGRLFGTYALPIVGDHKTTKDEKWIKSIADLSADEQLLGYGMEALRRTGAPAVLFQWIYYLTTEPYRSFPVRFWLDAETLEREWDALEKVSQAMVDVVQIGNYRDVIATKSACSNYGGCYYRPLCQAKGDAMKDAKIWAKLNKPSEASATQAAPPAQAPVAVATPGQVNPPANPAPKFKRPAPVVVAQPEPAAEEAPQEAPEATSVPAEAEAAQEPQEAAEPAPAPKRRGRPPKAEAAPANMTTSAAPTEGNPPDSFVLLVDCGIDKGGRGQSLIDVFAPAMTKAAEDNQQPNWRFIPYTAAAALAMAVDKQLDEAMVKGFVRLDTGTPEGNALLPLLAARAFLVIRGY